MRRILVLLIATAAWGQNTPGVFDYYLLSLSWSPQYCSSPAGARDKMQCGGPRRYEFILHGLWPQFERGWPQFCKPSAELGNPLVERMLDIMPSRRLIRHEWEKHGACSGLSGAEYFAKARTAFAAVRIPPALQNPRNARTVAPERIRDEFVAANPGLGKAAVTAGCAGRFLNEVRVCLGKDLKPRACSAEVLRQGCRAAEVIVPPVR